MKFFNNILNKILSSNDTSLALAYSPCYSYILGTLKSNLKVTLENYSASISKENSNYLHKLSLKGQDLLNRQISFTNLAMGISYNSTEQELDAKMNEFKKEIYNILHILSNNKLNVLTLDIYTIATDNEKFSFSFKINPLILPADNSKINNLDISKYITVTNL